MEILKYFIAALPSLLLILLGISVKYFKASGPTESDSAAEIFADGVREVAVWIYPQDPDLPGLARAAYAESMAEVCNANKVFTNQVSPAELQLQMIGYRPRRRAVVRVSYGDAPQVVYVKVLRARLFDDVLRRHNLLAAAGIDMAGEAPRIDARRRRTGIDVRFFDDAEVGIRAC